MSRRCVALRGTGHPATGSCLAPGLALLVFVVAFVPALGARAGEVAEPLVIRFTPADWPAWQNATSMPWHPKVRYVPEAGPDGEVIVRADSKAAASMLTRKVQLDLARTPWVTWSWKVAGTIPRADEQARRTDDMPARIYFFWNLRRKEDLARAEAVAYVWGNSLPAGTVRPAPDSNRIAIHVLRSGDAGAGAWHPERRNLEADYRAFFHRPPTGLVTAVALLTDTDQTKASATAWYGPITARAD